MKLYELIRFGESILKDSGITESANDAKLLWYYVSGMNSLNYLTEKMNVVDDALVDNYVSLINERAKRVPLQYITGIAGFMGMDFYTSKNVLIPRMDTETLVEESLKLIKKCKNNKPAILDMCCGSGCIGISISILYKDSKVTLADISDDAICLSDKNAASLGSECKIVKSDLFDNITDTYDFIISNPPYIETDAISWLMPEVRDYEPILALDGSKDGLLFYRRIIDDAYKYLKDDGYVLFEIGNNQAEDVQHLFVAADYDDVHVVKDINGNDRVVYAHKHS